MTDALLHPSLLLMAFGFTLGATLLLVPWVRSQAIRRNWVDKPDGERKKHGRATPTMGGLAIAGGFSAGLLFLYLASQVWGVAIHIPSKAFLFGALLMLLAGVYDDMKGLGYKRKLVVQLLVAYVLIYAGYRIDLSAIPFLASDPYQHAMVSGTLTLLWILGVINAVNFIDGLDGLAAGVVLIAFLCMAAVFGFHGQFGLVMIAVLMVAALAGFLAYNFNPASIFMGDSGSLFIGFAIAAYSLEAQAHANPLLAIIVPAVALGIPVMDTCLSVVRRVQERRAVWKPDSDHIHHRLASRYSVRQSVLILYFSAVLLGAAAIFMASATTGMAFSVFGLTLVSSYAGLRLLKYQPFGRLGPSSRLQTDRSGTVLLPVSAGDGSAAPEPAHSQVAGPENNIHVTLQAQPDLKTRYALNLSNGSTNMITEESIVKSSDALSTAEIDGEAIILDINSGRYFGLNRVGSRVLDIIQNPVEVKFVIDGIIDQFDVDRGRLEDDVIQFLNEMHQKKLVLVQE